jgi:hypothetical protein
MNVPDGLIDINELLMIIDISQQEKKAFRITYLLYHYLIEY